MVFTSSLIRATYNYWGFSHLPERMLGNFYNSSADFLLKVSTQSMASCVSLEDPDCRDDSAAKALKIVALASILVAGSIGVAAPIVCKSRNLVRADGGLILAVKAFAAGVILATGFVHMLPAGSNNLSNPCLSLPNFPFSGFFAMLSGLLTLLLDFLATHYYGSKHHDRVSSVPETDIEGTERPDGQVEVTISDIANDYGHAHGSSKGATDGNLRQVVVSQILELGIVSHSVIIGLSLGVSVSPCAIRPLIAALSFHQFFEGFALGGCIAQAEFKTGSTMIMACFFALTTPAGIALGMVASSVYKSNSPVVLITEGILDSLSAGILIYMSLVDLIAEQFLGSKSVVNIWQQCMFYCLLLAGGALMSLLAIWA